MSGSNDLRRMLDDLADETPEVSAQEWLDGTRHKVRVRRRVRWAGGGLAVALVLAVGAAVVPQVVDDAAPDPEPVEPAPPSDGRPGWPGLDPSAADSIVVARSNDEGASELRWTTTSPGRQVLLAGGEERRFGLSAAQFCQLTKDADTTVGPRLRVVSSVNGRIWARSTCDEVPRYPPQERAAYRRLKGVETRGEEITVSMWLERDGRRVDVSGAELGFLLYWQCGGAVDPPGTGSEVCGFAPVLSEG
jgi:hypothetical protein